MTTWIRDDGALVEVWTSTCECGFVSGLGKVTKGKRSLLISGVGCFKKPRRGPEEVKEQLNNALRS